MGGAGWLASLFGFLFVLMLFEPRTPVGSAVGGVVMLGTGLGLYRADRDSAFFEQLALALWLAGQLGLMYAVAEATDSATATAAFTGALSATLVLTLPNRFARTLSAFFACIAWALTVRLALFGENWFDDPRQAVGLAPALIGWLVTGCPLRPARTS